MVEDGPPGEFADIDKKQLGDWTVDGRAELVKDAGEDGGARRDGVRVVFWLEIPADWAPFPRFTDAVPSGIRDAGTIRFPPFWDPKQDNPPKHPLHLVRCKSEEKYTKLNSISAIEIKKQILSKVP